MKNIHKVTNSTDRVTIDMLKDDVPTFQAFVKHQNDSQVVRILKNLGRLENNHSKELLLDLLKRPNDKIRVLSIKNLAKLSDISLLPIFVDCTKENNKTEIRKEAVSAIGRLKDANIISVLIGFLKDEDPEVILQAIRGLLAFSKRAEVITALENLREHPNELVIEMIRKETTRRNGEAIASPQKSGIDPSQIRFPSFLSNTVVHGDVREVLKNIPDESVHLTFTSPPYYNARDYSIYRSYQEYLDFLESLFKDLYRTTKEGRFFVLNTSPIIIPRISRSHASKRYPIPYDIHPLLVNIGWEFIDDIVWVKPEASVKNRNAGFLQHRKPLGYKPNAITEMLMVYRKKTDKLTDWNMRQYPPDTVNQSKISGKYETTNIWKIDPTFDKVHSAVFPIELCHRVIEFYSYVGDLVFDPFAGSGTLGNAAVSLDRKFFLVEQQKAYIRRIEEKLLANNCSAHFTDAKTFSSIAQQTHDHN